MQLALAGIERALFSHGDESRSGLRDRPADTAVVADEEPAPLRLRLEALVVIGAATARVLDAPLVAPLMRHLVNERRDALDDRAVHSRGPEIDLTVARAASTLPRLSRHEVPVGTRCRVDRDD